MTKEVFEWRRFPRNSYLVLDSQAPNDNHGGLVECRLCKKVFYLPEYYIIGKNVCTCVHCKKRLKYGGFK